MQAPRRLQLRRGNTAAVSTYLGAPGELIINTDTNTLYVHNGVTVGGIASTVNTSAITGNISSLQSSVAVLQGNILTLESGITTLTSNAAVQAGLLATLLANAGVQSGDITSLLANAGIQSSELATLTSNAAVQAGALSTLTANAASQSGALADLVANAAVQAGLIAGAVGTYSNSNVSAYLTTNLYTTETYVNNQIANISIPTTYSNSNVASYLTQGNVTIVNPTLVDNVGSEFQFLDGALRFPGGNGAATYGAYVTGNGSFLVYPTDDSEFMVQTYATTGAGSRQWKITAAGNLEIPDDGSIVSDANVRIFATENVAIATETGGTWLFGTDGTTQFPDSTINVGTNKIDIMSSDYAELWYHSQDGAWQNNPSWNQEAYVYVQNDGVGIQNVRGADGNSSPTWNHTWKFNNDGNIQFPDSTVQTTAFNNAAISTYLVAETAKTIHGNVSIQGNLTVNGNVTYINVLNYTVGDNIINFADGNPADTLDLGFAAHRTVGGTLEHTGLVRDSSDNTWRLFSNIDTSPGTTVDFTNAIYDAIRVGDITSPTIDALTANAGAQAGTLATITANLGAVSGSLATLTANAASQAGSLATITSVLTSSNVGIGSYAGLTSQGQYAVAIGIYAGSDTQGERAVAIGSNAGKTSQGAYAVAIGRRAGETNQGNNSIIINATTGVLNQTTANTFTVAPVRNDVANVSSVMFYNTTSKEITYGNTISIAGNITGGSLLTDSLRTSETKIALGYGAGSDSQGGTTVAVGAFAGMTSQGESAVAIGFNAGQTTQGIKAVAIGMTSGYTLQGNYAVAIGDGAGYTNQGVQSIAIGRFAGLTNQANNTIILNATGANLNQTTANTFTVAPVRNDVANISQLMFYNTTSKEVTYGNTIDIAGNVSTTGYFLGNGALLTGIVASAGTTYSNTNVASYLTSATITTSGNITAAWLSGNISITGNVVGTSPNVTIQAGSYSSTFNNQGNVILPNLAVTGNVISGGYFLGNGALLTGIVSGGGTNYSNVNVAVYLGNVSTNINPVPNDIWGLGAENKEWYSAHIKHAYIKETIQAYSGGGYSGGNAGELLKSTGSGIAWQEIKTVNGNSLFGNGDITISGGGSTYGDSNVASYLPTYTGNIGNIDLVANLGAVSGSIATLTSNAAAQAGIISNLTNYANANVASYLPTYSGNITAGNITATGNVSAAYFVTTGGYGNISQVDTITANNGVYSANVTVNGIGVTMPNRPAFRVVGNGGQITATANITSGNFTVDYNQGNYLTTSTGVFTAPVAGLYSVHLVVRTATNTNLTINQAAVLKNNANVMCMVEFGANTSMNHAGVSTIAQLAVGDVLTAKVLVGTISFDGNDNWSVAYIG